MTDFETHTRSALSGGTDLIAKPIVLIELAVKALIHLTRGRLAAAASQTAHHGKAQQTTQKRTRPLLFPPATAGNPKQNAAH
jgi:hypothetical protein